MANGELRLYDTLTKRIRPLETGEPGHLRFYSCGPTVYSYAHIGNFRSFLTADLIVRTARALGWRVTWVSNITDVGHLTEDDIADAEGEDKMERALRSKEGKGFANVWELAEYYTDAYREDWRRLNLTEPEVRPKATQHVREQILAAEKLVEKGFAYETPTGVYYSVEAFPEYGKLSGNTQDALRTGVREGVVQDDNKRDPADFAVWKKDDRHLMQWYSPYGWGFPGWHIECSVMARAYLGDTLDLHSGGEDNKFPHHECEIAQSEALTGKPFSNHWVHTKFLLVDGEKMSKSKGNFFTVRGLIAEGTDPLALRLALMGTSFTKELNFTREGLAAAERTVRRMREADARASAEPSGEDHGLASQLPGLAQEAMAAMADNLNTSVAVAKALEGARAILAAPSLGSADAAAARSFMDGIESLLGIVRGVSSPAHETAPGVDEGRIRERIDARNAARKAKDFALADAIRQELAAEGIELTDTPEGTVWSSRG